MPPLLSNNHASGPDRKSWGYRKTAIGSDLRQLMAGRCLFYAGRPPRRSTLAHVDQAAAPGAAEPHTSRQRPGRRPMVDLEDFPRRYAVLAMEIGEPGADGGADGRSKRWHAGAAVDPAIPQNALAPKPSASEVPGHIAGVMSIRREVLQLWHHTRSSWPSSAISPQTGSGLSGALPLRESMSIAPHPDRPDFPVSARLLALPPVRISLRLKSAATKSRPRQLDQLHREESAYRRRSSLPEVTTRPAEIDLGACIARQPCCLRNCRRN
jgi:hypothetical protein